MQFDVNETGPTVVDSFVPHSVAPEPLPLLSVTSECATLPANHQLLARARISSRLDAGRTFTIIGPSCESIANRAGGMSFAFSSLP